VEYWRRVNSVVAFNSPTKSLVDIAVTTTFTQDLFSVVISGTDTTLDLLPVGLSSQFDNKVSDVAMQVVKAPLARMSAD